MLRYFAGMGNQPREHRRNGAGPPLAWTHCRKVLTAAGVLTNFLHKSPFASIRWGLESANQTRVSPSNQGSATIRPQKVAVNLGRMSRPGKKKNRVGPQRPIRRTGRPWWGSGLTAIFSEGTVLTRHRGWAGDLRRNLPSCFCTARRVFRILGPFI